MKNLRLTILFTALVALSLVALVMASDISQSKNTNPLTPNIYHVGDTIHYVMTVTNPASNSPTNTLNNIYDTDPHGDIHYFVEQGVDPPIIQAPGDSNTFNLDYTVLQADVIFTLGARRVVNKLDTNGVDSLDDPVTAHTEKNSKIITPCIDVNKTVDPTVATVGEEVTYTITICNCGDANLTLTAVDDNVGGVITDWLSFVPAAGLVLDGGVYNGAGQLQLGECTTFQVPYTVQEGDPDPLCDVVCATGEDELGGPAGTVTDCDPACLDLVEPNLMVVKECNEFSKVGDSIHYDVTITNTGDTDLQILSVEDTVAGSQSGCVGNTLAASGGTCSLSYNYTVQAGDPDALINMVTVTAKAVGFDANVTDSTTCETEILHPDLTVTKECLTDPVTGDMAQFRITITNTGDVNLIITTDEPELPGPNTLAKNGGSIVVDVNRVVPAGSADVNNTVNVTATLPPEYQLSNVLTRSSSASCSVPSTGITRTWGFWAQHCDFTARVFECSGAPIDLGWVLIPNNADGLSKLYGVFRTHDDKKGCSFIKDSDLCQARIQASVQALAAILTSRLSNGASLPISETDIANTLAGCNVDAINTLAGLLDTFNNMNDTGTALDCNGKAQGNASGGCAKKKGNCAALNSLCTATCP